MVHFLYPLFLIVLFSVGLQAQTLISDEQKARLKARQEAAIAELALSEEQTLRVEAINQAYWQGLADMDRSRQSRLKNYRKIKELGKKRDQEMKAVLNREQYERYLRQQEENKEEIRNYRRSRQ